ncbi:helix-turn-helix domain-containing protein [Streptomyces sp. M10(2022)]
MGVEPPEVLWDESKLSRIENTEARIRPAEVAQLLQLYGVTDSEVVAALEGLARTPGSGAGGRRTVTPGTE